MEALTRASNEPPPFAWDKLPEEIKCMVFAHFLSPDATITYKKHGVYTRFFLEALLTTNRDFQKRALKMYTARLHQISVINLDTFVRPPPTYTKMLTRVEIKLHPYCYMDELKVQRRYECSRLRQVPYTAEGLVFTLCTREKHNYHYKRCEKPRTCPTDARLKLELPKLTSFSIARSVVPGKKGAREVTGFHGCVVEYWPYMVVVTAIEFKNPTKDFKIIVHKRK